MNYLSSIRRQFFQAKKNWLKNLRPFYKKRTRPSSRAVWWFGFTLVLLGIFSYFTNPFMRFSVVNEKVEIEVEQDSLSLERIEAPILRDRAFFSQLAFAKSGWHIFSSKFAGGPKASRASVDQIIEEIHRLRFDPELPFIISGDHFSVFYNRSLGIFYHSLLDSRTALDETDWFNRQLIYAKSTLYALEVYSQSDRLSTTIVPIGPKSVALLNIYAYPADTLYSLLYAIAVLSSDEPNQIYQFQTTAGNQYQLNTKQLAAEMLERYREDLIRHIDLYKEKVVDSQTGLIKKDIWLSSTKDLVFRESSFYDNVILWRTYQLANELGLLELEDQFLSDLKKKIIQTFWLEESGYFLDHLSQRAIETNAYSSDWLIAYQTGFLEPENEADQAKLESIIAYIRRNALDRPFGMAYQAERRPWETHFFPRTFAPDYGSTAIWSNWGQEYIKLLAEMALVTEDEGLLNEAESQISSYAYNIRRYRGYPEVYNNEGDFYRQTFYKSIRQTGWVVSFEQARALVEWAREDLEDTTNET